MSTEDELAAQKERPARARALLMRTFKNAGGPMTAKNFKAALDADEDFRSGLMQVVIRSPWEEDDGDWGMGPAFFQIALNGAHSPGLWSDAYGYEFYLYLTGQALADCLAHCDMDKNAADDWCDVATAMTFAAIQVPVVVATVIVWWTGPGAAVTFATGTATSTGVATGVSIMCKGISGRNRFLCQEECRRRP